jgi:hypothetical protein
LGQKHVPGFGEEESAMKMRSLRWNLVVWHPSAGPADPFGAPSFTRVAWAIRTRWQPIFLVAGALLMVIGLMLLHNTMVFIAGVLMVGTSSGAPGPHSPTAAMVRTWEWLYKGHAEQR